MKMTKKFEENLPKEPFFTFHCYKIRHKAYVEGLFSSTEKWK